jgi:hypothetical protein
MRVLVGIFPVEEHLCRANLDATDSEDVLVLMELLRSLLWDEGCLVVGREAASTLGIAAGRTMAFPALRRLFDGDLAIEVKLLSVSRQAESEKCEPSEDAGVHVKERGSSE